MNSKLRALITAIYSAIRSKVIDISKASLTRKVNISAHVLAELNERVTPLLNDMFKEGRKISNLIVKQEVANLAANFELPIKYNKDLFMTFNSNKSIFTGYYDVNYSAQFTKSEINRLKRTILSGNYGKLSEKEMITQIRNTVNVSEQRARLLARNETARLNTAAQSIYHAEIKVKNQYNKVWIAESDARPSHKAMDGQVADKDGWFTTTNGTKTQGPPNPDSPYNCRCKVILRKKDDVS